MRTAQWIWVALLSVGLILGWFAKSCTVAPPPDIAALLRERDSVLGRERMRQLDSARQASGLAITAATERGRALDAAAADLRRDLRATARDVRTARAQTDSVMASMDSSARAAVILALAGERDAQRIADSLDALLHQTMEQRLAAEQSKVAALIPQRAADSSRIQELERTLAKLGKGLEGVRGGSFDPALAATYAVDGSKVVTLSATVRPLPRVKWLRAGVSYTP